MEKRTKKPKSERPIRGLGEGVLFRPSRNPRESSNSMMPTGGQKAFVIPSQPGFQARFVRYECKYLVTIDQLAAIRAYIRPFMRVDPHAVKSPDHSYSITSLYLDSGDLRLFRETRDGALNRIKLRIRNYDDAPKQPAFLEIKRRNNGVVNKGRARLPRAMVEIILRGGAVDASRLKGEERACYEEFLGWIGRWGAAPVVWVRYQREAYMGALDPSIRITLDRDLICAPSNGSCLDCRNLAWWPIESCYYILELKFNQSFPPWMENLVRCLSLKRISFSKYGNSVIRGLAPWLRIPG